MSSAAFGQTLQFVTNVKLRELEKQRQAFHAHVTVVLENARAASNGIDKVGILLQGIKGWQGAWSTDGTDLRNIEQWIQQAKRDPGFSASVVQEWGDRLERQISNESTQYDYARLFGNLLTEWVQSSPHSESRSGEGDIPNPGVYEKVNRAETTAQTEQLESIIFQDSDVNTDALQKYLEDLFMEKEASRALERLRDRLGAFGMRLRQSLVSVADMDWCIASLLATDLLSDAKQRTLKEFAANPTIAKEIASVLNMQLATLDTWCWPADGVGIEPRRALNGKVRFFLDPEILTALLLQFIGVKWSIELKAALQELYWSSAWKRPPPTLNSVESLRRQFYVKDAPDQSIDAMRLNWQTNYFMCQLPSNEEASRLDAYNEDNNLGRRRHQRREPAMGYPYGPRFDSPIEMKQTLLHLLSTDILLNKTLHGRCTVVCTDLQWFGPSLSHQAILTVLRYIGLTDADLGFIQSFLECPLQFPDPTQPSRVVGAPRVRVRGTPVSFALSAFCGEAVLSVMDFAVNQRADALFLYRLHDDFWFLDSDAQKCSTAWKELERFAALAGLTFNVEKTGCVQVGLDQQLQAGLPSGDIRWGLLRLDGVTGKFILDDAEVDKHIAEMGRQLAATNSIFAWVQAYNAYMAFFVRNCGKPAYVFGRAHVDSVIETLVKIHRVLLPKEGGNIIAHIAPRISEKFGVEDIPMGWYLWPTAAGGLQLRDYTVDLLLVRAELPEVPEESFADAVVHDQETYEFLKKQFEESSHLYWRSEEMKRVIPDDEDFLPFEEYIKGRTQYSYVWKSAYGNLMQRPRPIHLRSSAAINASIRLIGDEVEAFDGDGRDRDVWDTLDAYWKWIIALHHNQMVQHFGGLAVVKPSSIPVGMVALFKGSKMRWEQ